MKSLFASLFLFVLLAGVRAQGDVVISYGNDIQLMKDKFITQNKMEDEIKGWRIQVITTDDRRKMESAISKFSRMYPDVDLSWNHVPPYYRVRVGAYENKMQLMGFLLDLKQDFPSVIPVVDNISKSELVR